MKKLLLSFVILLILNSCTDNTRARRFGGTETVELKPQEKFINITWKENDLWIVVQDTTTGIYYAKEKSSFGIWEGTIIITKQGSF